jgi:hypothetical protein
MNASLKERLKKAQERIVTSEFLAGRGIANEIAFYVFDYPPEDELGVREYIPLFIKKFQKERPGHNIVEVNLFDFVLGYLRKRHLLDKALKMQQEKGDAALQKALAGPLHETKLAAHFSEVIQPEKQALVLLTGIGSAWPLLRSHSLLNNLHPVMGKTPLVMFYPGKYDGQSLKLFGRIRNTNYYRAFKLVP